jgi:hypothetical protein
MPSRTLASDITEKTRGRYLRSQKLCAPVALLQAGLRASSVWKLQELSHEEHYISYFLIAILKMSVAVRVSYSFYLISLGTLNLIFKKILKLFRVLTSGM